MQVEVAVHDRSEPVAVGGAEGVDRIVHQIRFDLRLSRRSPAGRARPRRGQRNALCTVPEDLGQPFLPAHEQRRQQLRPAKGLLRLQPTAYRRPSGRSETTNLSFPVRDRSTESTYSNLTEIAVPIRLRIAKSSASSSRSPYN